MLKLMFPDRQDAGEQLAQKLASYQGKKPLVLALPRGGVVIGFEVAKALQAPLDALVVCKIGAPGQPELGIGAVAEGGVQLFDKRTINTIGIEESELEEVVAREKKEVSRRASLYRKGKKLPTVEGRTVIIVDDGVATGVTAKAAIEAVRRMQPKKLVFATPVVAHETWQELEALVDEFVALATPAEFAAVGVWYQNFEQVSDEEVVRILEKAKSTHLGRRN